MHSKVVKNLKVASKEACQTCYGHQHASAYSRMLCVFVQLYKRCSGAAVAADVGNRQVQLEQGIVHCIVLLED